MPELPVQAWEQIGATLDGNLTDLARDPATGRYLAVTDGFGVYVLDTSLARIEQQVEFDHQYSIDLTPLAGAAFVGRHAGRAGHQQELRAAPAGSRGRRRSRVAALSTDQRRRHRAAPVTVRDGAGPADVRLVARIRRSGADELITVTVPSPRHRRLVVSRFARNDMMLTSEFLPALGPGLAVRGDDRSLAEYVVTGAAVVDGLLYAISAAYSTLLVIDLDQRAVIAAYAVPGLEHPVGLAARGAELQVSQADGRIAVIGRP